MTDRPLGAKRAPTTAEIFSMTWPMALRAVMMFSIVIIDLYLVASLGEEAVAAIGIANIVAVLVMGTNFAFANAMQVKVAQAFGTDDPLELKTAFYAGLVINLILVATGIILILVFGPMVIDVLAHSPQIAKGATQYLLVFTLVLLAESLSAVLTSYFNGCGRTKLAFFSFLISAPLNIGSSIVLIFGLYGFPELGLVGAAWGSFIGAAMRLVYLGAMMSRSTGYFAGVKGWVHGTLLAALRRQFAFSWPIAATFVSMTFANQACSAIYANLNVYQFAAITLIMPWVRIAGQLSYTWTQATGILVAQSLGKSLPEAALEEFLGRAWRAAFVAAGVVAVIYGGIVLASGWIYADLARETRATLFGFLPILLLLPFPRVSNAICGNVLRAAGDSKSSMKIHLGANWLFMVPATAVCVLILDLSAVWVFALFLAEELVKFLPFHRRIWSKEWLTLKT